jgi:glutathione-independent formaldehyde dehydrogenase
VTNYCLVANPDPQIAGAAYGFATGPWNGGQAEYLLVPWADFNCLRLPEDAEEKLDDYVMLADIFPTGYHATEMAGVGPGKSVVIYGGGPVGLMAAYSAVLKGPAGSWWSIVIPTGSGWSAGSAPFPSMTPRRPR